MNQLNPEEDTRRYDKVGLSTITAGGLQTIINPQGCSPEYILERGVILGVEYYQMVVLRGMNFYNIVSSGLAENITTIEAPRTGLQGRILCGEPSLAIQTSYKLAVNIPDIINIDFLPGGAIEIADCEVKLFNPDNNTWDTYQREIEGSKRMIFDTFHARDFTTLGRDKTFQGHIPSKKDVAQEYKSIFDIGPDIVGIHLQERNPNEIKRFLESKVSHREFEINLLKQYVSNQYNKVPVILELNPVPLSPLGGGVHPITLISELRKNTDTMRKIIDKINEIRYR